MGNNHQPYASWGGNDQQQWGWYALQGRQGLPWESMGQCNVRPPCGPKDVALRLLGVSLGNNHQLYASWGGRSPCLPLASCGARGGNAARRTRLGIPCWGFRWETTRGCRDGWGFLVRYWGQCQVRTQCGSMDLGVVAPHASLSQAVGQGGAMQLEELDWGYPYRGFAEKRPSSVR